MDDYIIDRNTIDTIDEDTIRSVLMNEGFCMFIDTYATIVSNTRTKAKEIMKRGGKINLFAELSDSDIAWALMVYVNNRDLWTSQAKNILIERSNQAKMKMMAQASQAAQPSEEAGPAARRGARKTGGKKKSSTKQGGQSEASGGTGVMVELEPPVPEVKKLWHTPSRTAKKLGVGVSPDGVLFYCKIHRALKGIDDSEWEVLWKSYYNRKNPDDEGGDGSDDEGDMEDAIYDEAADSYENGGMADYEGDDYGDVEGDMTALLGGNNINMEPV